MPGKYFIGVDVGTSSVRAALVSIDGKVVTTTTNPIKIWEPRPDFYEQSSDDIWNSCSNCVKVFQCVLNIISTIVLHMPIYMHGC